jgi:hypothetical protein
MNSERHFCRGYFDGLTYPEEFKNLTSDQMFATKARTCIYTPNRRPKPKAIESLLQMGHIFVSDSPQTEHESLLGESGFGPASAMAGSKRMKLLLRNGRRSSHSTVKIPKSFRNFCTTLISKLRWTLMSKLYLMRNERRRARLWRCFFQVFIGR